MDNLIAEKSKTDAYCDNGWECGLAGFGEQSLRVFENELKQSVFPFAIQNDLRSL
nr:hypothetical protein [uncultured Pedobacter sp.]